LELDLSELEQRIKQQELSFEERRTLLWEALGRSPWMLSLEERDRPHLFQTALVQISGVGGSK
jgi:hypothetical protein